MTALGHVFQAILCGVPVIVLAFCIVDGIRKGDFRA